MIDEINNYEKYQWHRNLSREEGESLILRYVIRFQKDIDIDELDYSLRLLLKEKYWPLICKINYFHGDFCRSAPVLPQRVLIGCNDPQLRDYQTTINPNGGQLYCFSYFINDDNHLTLSLAFSHCVFDGNSYVGFLRDWETMWSAIAKHHPVIEPAAISRFSIETLQRSVEKNDLDFWDDYLSQHAVAHSFDNLPASDTPSASLPQYTQTLSAAQCEPFFRLLDQHKVSLFQGLTSVYAVALTQLEQTEKKSVSLAHTVNLRPPEAYNSCWINLVPLCIDVDLSQNWLHVFNEVKSQRRRIRKHQHVPTLTLLANDAVARSTSAIFNVVINESEGLLSNDSPRLGNCTTELVEKPSTATIADLALTYFYDGNRLILRWNSNGKRFNHFLLVQFAQHFGHLLQMAAQQTNSAIELKITQAEKLPVSVGAQSTRSESSVTPPTFASLFSSLLLPETHEDNGQLACIDHQQQWRYSAFSHSVAVVQQAMLPEAKVVGVYLSRRGAIPIAYLACLGLNKTFVPLDPALPEERLLNILDIAEVDVILIDDETEKQSRCSHFNATQRLNIQAVLRQQKQQAGNETPVAAPAHRVQFLPFEPNHIAYMMFTSGTTGAPKGVCLSASNLANFLSAMAGFPGINRRDRVAALTPISFDISLLEMLLPFVAGATLVIASDQQRRDGQLLAQWLNHHHVTYVQATPSTWRILQAAEWQPVQPVTILTGGEALPTEVADYLLGLPANVFNMYGPTEATIWASCAPIIQANAVALGQPVTGTQYYIFEIRSDEGNDNDNPQNKPQSQAERASVLPGQVGELIIAGDCVGLGYKNAPDNQAYFTLSDGTPAYATGDLVREVAPGQIRFLRRIDTQLKLNGFRIEPDEISQAIKQVLPDASVFTVLRRAPNPSLVSFVWQPDLDHASLQEVSVALRKRLPEYMQPSEILRLSRIPLSPAGKADVKALTQAPLDSLPLMPASQPSQAEQPIESQHFTRTHNSSFYNKVQQAVDDAIELWVEDVERPLGWYGLNSVSYNMLSAYFKKHWSVSIASFEFYRFNTLAELAGTLAERMGQPAVSLEQSDSAASRPAEQPSSFTGQQKVAIIGMDASLPNGFKSDESTLDAFWQGLIHNHDAVTPQANDAVLGDRQLYDAQQQPYAAAYLPDVSAFDARFFSMSPLEANSIDPRQRLLMQNAWRCIENAGYAAEHLAGTRTSCYVAATGADYALLQARQDRAQNPYALPGHSSSILANRISAFFDFTGASNTLDTACSGALVALTKAVKDIQAGNADYALAGGVSLILDTQISDGLVAGNFLSPDARCATFDASANGYVRGEGSGLFLLKGLDNAQRDNDRILGVIEAAAENHGGKANSLTAPNPKAQQALLEACYPRELMQQVSYIETHGTGTELGDPIEVSALIQAWQNLTSPEHRANASVIHLGAVKTQVGHLEAAAGVASLAKVLLAFQHQTLPANLHFQQLNPQIQLADTPFRILTDTQPWLSSEQPRVAGISSFGFGGANAHIVVSEPPPVALGVQDDADSSSWVFPLSAKNASSLQSACENLATWLVEHPELSLRDVAYTLAMGRSQFDYRVCCVASHREALIAALNSPNIVHCPGYSQPTKAQQAITSTTPSEVDATSSPEAWQARFLQGGQLDWQPLWQNQYAQRCELPVYVFATRSHWLK